MKLTGEVHEEGNSEFMFFDIFSTQTDRVYGVLVMYFSGSFTSIQFILCLLSTLLLHRQIRTRLIFCTS